MPPPSDRHYIDLALAIQDGEVVPFLGAGANMCGRTKDATAPWQPQHGLPDAVDLARYLAGRYYYSDPHGDDLLRVAQFIATMRGYRPLYKTLHELFDVDFEPTPLHTFLAGLPTLLSGAPHAERSESFSRYQLIVTTNYDDTLERAFAAAAEPYDLVTYHAEGAHGRRGPSGRFLHWPAGGEPRVIEEANTYYDELPLETRSVILKIHGLVVRSPGQSGWESFVITEDHYIEYLAQTDLSELLPIKIVERLRNSNLLFLGYALRDWNLRVILQSIWSERDREVPSWAIQVRPDEFDEEFWQNKHVKIFDEDLARYVETVGSRLREVLRPAQV